MTVANVVAGNRVPYSNAVDEGMYFGQWILMIRQMDLEGQGAAGVGRMGKHHPESSVEGK